jgi:hypothetical protein
VASASGQPSPTAAAAQHRRPPPSPPPRTSSVQNSPVISSRPLQLPPPLRTARRCGSVDSGARSMEIRLVAAAASAERCGSPDSVQSSLLSTLAAVEVPQQQPCCSLLPQSPDDFGDSAESSRMAWMRSNTLRSSFTSMPPLPSATNAPGGHPLAGVSTPTFFPLLLPDRLPSYSSGSNSMSHQDTAGCRSRRSQSLTVDESRSSTSQQHTGTGSSGGGSILSTIRSKLRSYWSPSKHHRSQDADDSPSEPSATDYRQTSAERRTRPTDFRLLPPPPGTTRLISSSPMTSGATAAVRSQISGGSNDGELTPTAALPDVAAITWRQEGPHVASDVRATTAKSSFNSFTGVDDHRLES